MLSTPFPTVFEGLRLLFKALDIKGGNKAIDDEARNVWADYRYLDEFITGLPGERLEGYISKEVSSFFQLEFKKIVDDYLLLVATHSADGLTREEVMQPLVEFWLVPRIASLVNSICFDAKFVSAIELLSSQSMSVSIVLGWLDQNSNEWLGYKKQCEKEQKDRISAWQRGEDMPSAHSIALLGRNEIKSGLSVSDWLRIKTLLFISRALDFIRKERLGKLAIARSREYLLGAKISKQKFNQTLGSLRIKSLRRIPIVYGPITNISEGMLRKKEKPDASKDSLRLDVDFVRSALKKQGEYNSSSFFVDWMDARWYVFSNDLIKANELYKQAVESAIYRAGDQLKAIVKEALVVAASIKKSDKASPDKTFLKQLKNVSILFKLDTESVDQLQIKSPENKLEDFVQLSEVEMWKGHFNTVFPAKGFFSQHNYFHGKDSAGPILLVKSKHTKPDYQHVNRNIKVGEAAQKIYPQIVWFILNGSYEVVKRLIAKGARVDVNSSSGDTPLIMALEKLVVMEFPRRSFDDSFYKLIIEQSRVSDTVNSQTQKRKLTPLLLAVKSGRPEIVEKLLSLGANPNLRGDSDNQTALNICLKILNLHKNPNRLFESFIDQRITPEALDSFRRETNALYGHMLEDQVQAMSNRPADLLQIERYIVNDSVNQILEFINPDDMRAIFKMLLDKGADPNSQMTTPLKGYTPLMLAVEKDLDEEVAMMLSCEGDLNEAYVHPDTREKINSWRIAELWKSKKVLRLMNDIKPIYQKYN